MAIHQGGVEVWRERAREAMKKRWVKIAGGVVAVFVLFLVVAPFFINADTFRPTAENEISSALGRRVTLGHLGLSLFSGSLTADNVAISDDPAFSSAPFFETKSMHIGVSVPALLFSRKLHVTKFTADSPQVHLISKPDGSWNYASLGRGTSPSSGSQQSSTSGVSIGELKIKDGSIDVTSVPATGAPFVYNHVNLTVKHLSFTTPMPFDLTADLPAGGTVQLSGTAGPIGQPNAMNTPLRATLHVKHFDPVAAGVIPASEGISAVADLDAQVTSDGKTLSMTGKMQAAQLKLSGKGSPAPQPVNVDLTTNANIGARTGQISDLAIHTGAVAAHVTGNYQMTGQTVVLDLHLSGPGLPIDGIEQLLPAVGVTLPSGSSLHGGTLTANLAITGPAAALRIAGPVEIDNTQLAGFALASKIEGLSSPGSNTGNGTNIRLLRANVTNTPQSTDLSQISCDIPELGSATGNGTVSAAGALNFQLVAKMGGAGAGAVNSVAGNFLNVAAPSGIPLTVTGTTSNPSIRANVGSMVKQQASGLLGKGSNTKSGVEGAVQGILHK
jgi:AsmA protein